MAWRKRIQRKKLINISDTHQYWQVDNVEGCGNTTAWHCLHSLPRILIKKKYFSDCFVLLKKKIDNLIDNQPCWTFSRESKWSSVNGSQNPPEMVPPVVQWYGTLFYLRMLADVRILHIVLLQVLVLFFIARVQSPQVLVMLRNF